MIKRTFKVVDENCTDCELNKRCKISGIERDVVYQSLADAKLYTFVQCEEDMWDVRFMEVKENILN